MDNLLRDLRFALRQLARSPGFTAAAVLTLALGIGATSAMFTVVDAVLLKALPYRDPSRLVVLTGTFDQEGEVQDWPLSQLDFGDWRRENRVFQDMSLFANLAFNLEREPESERLEGELVNASYFDLLGVKPALGRFFTPLEDKNLYEHYVVVLGHHLWRRSFGGDPRVLGKLVDLNGKRYRVIGVAPEGFRGLTDQADLWVHSMLPPIPDYVNIRRLRWAMAVARLKPSASPVQAQDDMDRIASALAREYPDMNEGMGARVTPLKDYWFGKLRYGLLILTAGACIILLIACINVANLLLTRAVTEQRGYAIRMAVGAGRGRLVRQLLTEGILLALVGAALGLVLSRFATRALVAASGVSFQSFVHFGAAPEVVAAILAVAVLCGAAFGLAPLWITFRADMTESLGRESKQPPRGKGWHRVQSAVVVAQVALALILSIGAGLMAKSFQKMVHQDLGFRGGDLLTFRIDLRGPKYRDDEPVVKLLRDYLDRLSAVPGVAQLAMADPAIPTDYWAGGYMTIEDHPSESPDGTYMAMMHSVTPEYFDILGIPVRQGRAYDLRQDANSFAVIVSQHMADQQWPGQNPIGNRLKTGARTNVRPWLTVVGVAAEVKHEGIQGEKRPAPDMYLSLLQFPLRLPLTINFLVRAKEGISAATLMPALHREMMAINPDLPVYDVATMQERLARQTDKARFQIVLVSLFTVLALLLAAVGIYGVVAYSVSQRTREIAIRMSLGADRRRILRMVVGRGAVLAAIGVALGLVAIVLLSPVLVRLLYETSTTNPLILGGTALVLFLVALAANYLPARRAAKLQPATGLRTE